MTLNDLVFNLQTVNNLNPVARVAVCESAASFICNTVDIAKEYVSILQLQRLIEDFGGVAKPNNLVIDGPDYYRLPCGRYLEDYIAYCDLDFSTGSALKYAWRAGRKFGESRVKDLEKARHYCEFIARTNGLTSGAVAETVETLRVGADRWDGKGLA